MQRIAIVRLSALGDIIHAAFVLQFIKATYAKMHITWVCEEAFAPLFYNHPLIDELQTVRLKKLKQQKSPLILWQQIRELRSLKEFDKIIDMQGLIKSAVVARLIGKNTHGFDKNSIREAFASHLYATTSAIPYSTNVILRNAKVINDALDLHISKEMIAKKAPVFPIFHPDIVQKEQTRKNIAFVIGASWPSKKYPKEQLAEVIKQLDAQAWLIWGNSQEEADARYIANKTDAKIAQKMSLGELVSFISAMDLVIGNDTGPTHLAWAQNVPSIVLFGPTNERMMYQTPSNIAIHSPSDVDTNNINKNDFSIRQISPRTIVHAAQGVLDGI